jgi:diketogulonate reductase-like aldo/keto reductase
MSMDRRHALRTIATFAAMLSARNSVAQAQAMLTRTIPSTGEALPVIGLGTWQVFDVGGDPAARASLRDVLRAFFAGGGRLIDSSPMYGASESVVGLLSAEAGLLGKLFVATKVWTSGREAGIQQMETSFKRLRVERMDLMQIHNLVDVGVHTKTLADWKAKGRVRFIGITHYSASAYTDVEKWLKTGAYDFLQINYSLAERESAERLLPLARERKVAVIANRPFAEGAMFRKVRGKSVPDWAKEAGMATWAQYFLKWIVAHPAVTCVIPGTGKTEHLADNLAAGSGPLPGEALRKRMAEHFDSL